MILFSTSFAPISPSLPLIRLFFPLLLLFVLLVLLFFLIVSLLILFFFLFLTNSYAFYSSPFFIFSLSSSTVPYFLISFPLTSPIHLPLLVCSSFSPLLLLLLLLSFFFLFCYSSCSSSFSYSILLLLPPVFKTLPLLSHSLPRVSSLISSPFLPNVCPYFPLLWRPHQTLLMSQFKNP